jgi:hypothetical protein
MRWAFAADGTTWAGFGFPQATLDRAAAAMIMRETALTP